MRSANVGELYYNANLLRSWSGTGTQSISNYEKIRTLGRGTLVTTSLMAVMKKYNLMRFC